MLERMQSGDLERVVTAVMLERYLGGDLAEALERIAYTVRERRWGKRRMRAADRSGMNWKSAREDKAPGAGLPGAHSHSRLLSPRVR